MTRPAEIQLLFAGETLKTHNKLSFLHLPILLMKICVLDSRTMTFFAFDAGQNPFFGKMFRRLCRYDLFKKSAVTFQTSRGDWPVKNRTIGKARAVCPGVEKREITDGQLIKRAVVPGKIGLSAHARTKNQID